MGVNKLVEIDGEKLRNVIAEKNLSLAEVSRSLGFSNKFIGECIRRNSINRVGIVGLEHILGINFDDYKPAEPVNDCDCSCSPMYSKDYIKRRITEVCGTQTVLSRKIGRSEGYISSWLSGNTTIKLADIAGIAFVLRINKDRIPANFTESEQTQATAENECEPMQEVTVSVDNSDVIEKLDTIAEYLDKLLTGIANMIEVQDRQTKYLSHIMRNTRHFESFEETMQRVKAENQTMKVAEKN